MLGITRFLVRYVKIFGKRLFPLATGAARMGKGFRLSLAAFLALFLSAGALQAQLPSDCLPAREYAAALVRAAAGRLLSPLLGHVPPGF